MSHQSAPEAVYIIRHGEKPQDHAAKHPAAHSGVDFRGNQNEHSPPPRGWQRSGALAALFDPTRGPLGAGLRVPGMLISPSYGHASKTAERRNHQTIRGLSDRLGVEITADFAKGQEPQLATVVLNSGICEVDGLARCSRLSGRLDVDYLPSAGIRSLVDWCGDLRLLGATGGAW